MRGRLLLLLEESNLRLELSIFVGIRHTGDLDAVLIDRVHQGARVFRAASSHSR